MSDEMKTFGEKDGSASPGGKPLVVSWGGGKLPSHASSAGERSVSLSSVSSSRAGRVPLRAKAPQPSEAQKLPNASVVYGVGASILFVLALAILFNGLWLTALLVMLPAACFLGFAIHFIKLDSPDR